MYAAVARKAHQVQFLAVVAGVGVGSCYLRIVHDGTVVACTVYLDKVLIYHAACTDVEVSHLRIAHLSVGQSDVFA